MAPETDWGHSFLPLVSWLTKVCIIRSRYAVQKMHTWLEISITKWTSQDYCTFCTYACSFFMFTCTCLITFMLACIYLVHTTDVTRSQTGETDWEHKPNSKISYLCGKKETCAQAATVISWYYAIDYDIIDNIRKAQTINFYKFALYRSSKFDKTQFLRITHRL